MEDRHVALAAIHRKEEELYQLELDYKHQRKLLKEREEELYLRRDSLKHLIDDDNAYISQLLSKTGVSQDKVRNFFCENTQLLEASHQLFQKHRADLEEESMAAAKAFSAKQDQLESSIQEMRRNYARDAN